MLPRELLELARYYERHLASIAESLEKIADNTKNCGEEKCES